MPLLRFFVGYTYFAFASQLGGSGVLFGQRNNCPVDCKSGSRVFNNEPSRSLTGEGQESVCAGSTEKAGSYADYSKKRSKREYGITIAEDGMKISFVFLS